MAPLALLIWIASTWWPRARFARARIRELVERGSRSGASGSGLLEERERQILRSSEGLPPDPGAIREWARKSPFVSQVFVLGLTEEDPPPQEGRGLLPRWPSSSAPAGVRDAGLFFRRPEGRFRRAAPAAVRLVWGAASTSSSGAAGVAHVFGFELDRVRFLADAAVGSRGRRGPGEAGRSGSASWTRAARPSACGAPTTEEASRAGSRASTTP